jgi:protein-L-isoaspartate(D-aspartate) O-methyltransferase
MVDSQLRTNGVTAPWVVQAMGRIPRERFLPVDRQGAAYHDRSIDLGNGRMLNPPLTSALLIQEAKVSASDKVLLIGCGSGYIAALLSGHVGRLVAVESDENLAAAARQNVRGLELVENALAQGAAAAAPYDAIIIDGAIEQLPPAIEEQLVEGGRIVTGLTEGPVSRLATGTKHGGHIALRIFADLEVAPMPGFEREREFLF